MKDIYRNTVSDELWGLLIRLSRCAELVGFRLVGGTALALHLGHRISVDLDWFTDTAFDSVQISEILVREFGLEQAVIVENSISGAIEGIKIDVIAHRYPWIDGASSLDGARIASVHDISAMKLNAIANRGSKKDFWDVASLLRHYTLDELLVFFKKRYPHVNPWQVVRSLTYFEDAEEEPDPIVLDAVTWTDIKTTILAGTKNFI
jgi:predicted nucleotidyltransferase component of viral defense system